MRVLRSGWQGLVVHYDQYAERPRDERLVACGERSDSVSWVTEYRASVKCAACLKVLGADRPT